MRRRLLRHRFEVRTYEFNTQDIDDWRESVRRFRTHFFARRYYTQERAPIQRPYDSRSVYLDRIP